MGLLMLFLSARLKKRHLIICSNAEVHNHSRRRDGITLFVYLCVFLLRRAIGQPPTPTPVTAPAHTSQYLVNIFIKSHQLVCLKPWQRRDGG